MTHPRHIADLGEEVSVTLKLRRDAYPIQGSVGVRDELPRSFRGWLQLIGLLEAAGCLGPPSRDADPAVPDPSPPGSHRVLGATS